MKNNEHLNNNQEKVPYIVPETPQASGYTQQIPTQVMPQYPPFHQAPKASKTKKIVSSVLALGIPVVVTTAIVAAYLAINNKESRANKKQMQGIIDNLRLDVKNKDNIKLLDVVDQDLSISGNVPNGFETRYGITGIDAKSNDLITSLYLVAKDGTTLEKEIRISGFKRLDLDNQNAKSVLSAVESLRGNINAIKSKNDGKLVTRNNNNTLVSEYVYNNHGAIESDTELPLLEIEKNTQTNINLIQKPHYNPVTKEVDQLQVIATITSGDYSSEVSFIIDGFLSQTKKDRTLLDELFANFNTIYHTKNYAHKTAQEVMGNEYLEINKIFTDINFNIETIKINNPQLELEIKELSINGDNALNVIIDAKLNNATKQLRFKVDGFSSLVKFNLNELQEFAKLLTSPVSTRYHKNKLPSGYKYQNVSDLFNDLDWHLESELKDKNITIQIKSENNLLETGEKIISLVLSKNAATFNVQINVNNFKTGAQYAEYVFSEFFKQIPGTLYTTTNTDKTPDEITYDLDSLEKDTAMNFKNLASRYQLNLRVTAQNSDGHLAENGYKQVTLEAEIDGKTKTKQVIVEGFLTKAQADKLTFPRVYTEISDQEQLTINHKDKATNDPRSAYTNFDDFANDVQINFTALKSKYKGVVFKNFMTLMDNDGIRTVSFNVTLGSETKNKIIKIGGFLNNATALNNKIKEIKQTIKDTYTTNNYSDKLPQEAESLYTDIASLDNDLGANLASIAANNGVTISIKNKKPNNEGGTLVVYLTLTLEGKDYDEFFIIDGFTTPEARTSLELEAALNKFAESYITLNHKNQLPSQVNYANSNDLTNDLGIDLSTLIPGITLNLNNIHADDNDDTLGVKKVFITLNKDGISKAHTITINGFSTNNQDQIKKIEEFINNLKKEYTTLTHKNDHVSQVNYRSKLDLANDTGLDLIAKEQETGLLITIKSQTPTEQNLKEIILEVKSQLIPELARTTKISIQGYLDTTKFEENVLQEYISNFTTPFETQSYPTTFPGDLLPPYDQTKIKAMGGAKLYTDLVKVNDKYANEFNNRKLTFNYDASTKDINDNKTGTKTLHFVASYGSSKKSFTITFSGFYSENHPLYLLDKELTDFLNNQLNALLQNNGQITDNRYWANIPSAVNKSDVIFRNKNGSYIDPKFSITEYSIVPYDDELKLLVNAKVKITKDGHSLTKNKQIWINSGDPQKVIDNIFNNSDFGYVKLTRGYPLSGRNVQKHHKYGYNINYRTAWAKSFTASLTNGEENNLNVNYIKQPKIPVNIKVEFELARQENVKYYFYSYETQNFTHPDIHVKGFDEFITTLFPFQGAYISVNNDNTIKTKMHAKKFINLYRVDNLDLHGYIIDNSIPHPNGIDTYNLLYSPFWRDSNKDYKYDAFFFEPTVWINVKYTFLGKTYYKSIHSARPVIGINRNKGVFTNDKNNIYLDHYFVLSKAKAIKRQDGRA
ncbi:Uncharacterised protein [Mycoplasmopsis californica]|uniref:Lipoprotein 17-related variable surface protein n=1 Tax=Mycoplasmopsis equigenitalium TaxID=114883 RepID=A0ABY5J0A6_9BACT|nr:lipoprotein 17-related variable surface protein [Mycoplasmopsis equigenitalium]UUD36688.1 lipoprotein 17-related variable surface protein [Mycoplasmopsis equigenitalium]VEU69349.1 Uncharacterised protein [Mycoplasmopsis californica]